MLEAARGCLAGVRFKMSVFLSCLSPVLIIVVTPGASAGVQSGGGPWRPQDEPNKIHPPPQAFCTGCAHSKVCIFTYLSQKLSVFLFPAGRRATNPSGSSHAWHS